VNALKYILSFLLTSPIIILTFLITFNLPYALTWINQSVQTSVFEPYIYGLLCAMFIVIHLHSEATISEPIYVGVYYDR
jgi:hypothetical protein